MSNVSKPVIPREVADAIEFCRTHYAPGNRPPMSNEEIVIYVTELDDHPIATRAKLRSIPFDTLLAALVNGYEIEKSAEDKVRSYYEYWHGRALSGDNYAAAAHDVTLYVLDTLGIKIPGVNAPKEDVI